MDAFETNSTLYIYQQDTYKFKSIQDLNLAFKDLSRSITNYKLWSYMGLVEIRRRYRRTLIGPFWTTLSLGIFIGCMGVLLSGLWNNNPKEFLPYFCSGYMSWMLIQTIILEGCTTFTSSAAYMRQISLPYMHYANLVTWRNMIVYAHHIAVIAMVLIYARVPINLNILWLIPGLLTIFITGVWVSLLLGMICARFRDIQQIISSVMQLAMFVTPIMWQPEQLGRKGILVADLNPLYHLICIIRLPYLGVMPSLYNWLIAIGFSITGAIFTFLLFAKYYRKLIFWA